MKRIGRRALEVIFTGLLIVVIALVLMPNTIYIVSASSKSQTPTVISSSTQNQINYWLALQSSTNNAWTYPDYLVGVPRTQILPSLIPCESNGRATALNPKDRDGTASYGLLQFKPRTLWSEAIKYGLLAPNTPEPEIMKVIYSTQLQVDVASYMVMDNWKSVAFWKQQFPACSEKNNYWK